MINGAGVAKRWVTMLAVVVTVDPEGQLPDQLLRAVRGLCPVIEEQLLLVELRWYLFS
jgi:hypothetical protein